MGNLNYVNAENNIEKNLNTNENFWNIIDDLRGQ